MINKTAVMFILNREIITTNVAAGMVALDYIRNLQNLTDTKYACREGDCGACSVL